MRFILIDTTVHKAQMNQIWNNGLIYFEKMTKHKLRKQWEILTLFLTSANPGQVTLVLMIIGDANQWIYLLYI